MLIAFSGLTQEGGVKYSKFGADVIDSCAVHP